MQFSESWLRSFVNPALDTAQLAHLLTMSGLEVEDMVSAAPPFSGIVVGHVLEVVRHPNADKLNVCQVDAGTGSILNIVCGAPNVRVGIKVPCALIGAKLPPAEAGAVPFEIKLATMRGVESQGMLCSARELKLSEDHGGLLILADDAPIGADLRSVLDLDDQVFTLKLTPNKADCLSVHGVAREVAALTGATLTLPAFTPVTVSSDERLPVSILSPDLCGRFSGRIIRGLNARAKTPDWMKQRLARSGQRSVSALVDISNYVMLELGRPTHVFDLAKIHGNLQVRWGCEGETLKLLNGNTVAIDANVGIIADEKEVESLAGIMGGDATAVSLDTTDIYLEAAFWWPAAIQGRARRYNFSTDAAHRFERGVDYATTVEHIERISSLLIEICGTADTKIGPVDDQAVNVPVRKPVRLRVARASRIIGIAISSDEIAGIFTRLGFEFSIEAGEQGNVFVVNAPSYRFDIEIEEDLIEEVARCHGFERIPANLPAARHTMSMQPETLRSLHAIRAQLAESDYQEVVNFSFVEEAWERDFVGNEKPIRLLNPIASQLSVMRTSLIGSLVANLRYNLNRKAGRVRVFEVGKVFLPDATLAAGDLNVAGIAQPVRIGGLAYGPAFDEQWGSVTRAVDFFDVKADVEALLGACAHPTRFAKAEPEHPGLHPGRSAQIEQNGRVIGWVGELHPRWLQRYELPHAPIVFELEAAALQMIKLPDVQEIPKVPAVLRDCAFVFDQAVTVQSVLDIIAALRHPGSPAAIIRDVVLFDEYRGKGLKNNEKSLAFRFRLQDTQQTLSDQIVDAALSEVTKALHDKLGGSLRAA